MILEGTNEPAGTEGEERAERGGLEGLKDSDGVLHGGAVERAVLTDEDAAIDGDDVMAGEGALELTASEFVVGGLAVGGQEDCRVENEEVGVGGWEPMAIVRVIDGRRHRQREQTVVLCLAFASGSAEHAEGAELGFHSLECFVVFVGGVGALDVEDRVGGGQAGKGIDVAVGVVACEVAVIQPEDAPSAEVLEEALLDFLTSEARVALGRKEALTGGQQGAASVALNAAAFKDKV